MDLKFSIFVGKVKRYEKRTTIRLWAKRSPPVLDEELNLFAVSDPEPIARGRCVMVTPIILTRDHLYVCGRMYSPEALKSVAIADGFGSVEDFWVFFHLELDRLFVDASTGWHIQWEPLPTD
jgi:hypothetical protein